MAYRLYCLNTALTSSDPTLHGVLASVSTQIQISYAIIAVTTPCVRPFMTALSTNYGAPAKAKSSPSALGSEETHNSYSLPTLSRRSRVDGPPPATTASAPASASASSSVPQTRWDQAEHRTAVVSGDHHSIESHESRRMIISKNTEWAVEYEAHEQPSP